MRAMDMDSLRFCRTLAAAALVAAMLTACGDDQGDDEWIEISSPVAGDEVTVPFEVTIEASVPLGPPSEDVHHVHIWFGDDQSVFLVGEATTIVVDNAPNGAHTMHVALHFADHQPAGAQASLPLVIRGGSDVPSG
jgi:hypothetical protein